MGQRIVSGLIGLAALVAVASPLVLILLLDPRVGLVARRPAPAPAPAVQAAAPASPGPAAPAPPAACAPCAQGEALRPSVPPDAPAEPPERDARPPERPAGLPERPAAPPSPDPPERREATRGGAPSPEIATPDIAAERRAQRGRLLGFVAHPDRVSGSAAWLDVIGLSFTEPRSGEARAYRPLSVDLTEAPDRAVLLLTDQPLALTLATTPPARAGALGVESLAAFDLAQGRPDLLAGFRSAAFGTGEIAPLLGPVRFGRQTLARFCGALRLWSGRYGLALERLRYTLIENAGQVRLEGDRVRSDGTGRGRVSGRRLAVLCSP
ncbi:hypothetical protein [Methylobacterium sp. WSM2598]|uniref:hypothetical protein n=1 Tax=Methylobacterium sp. WSM2598 TaxID=398261 RepID=UPI0003A6D843|nr:hypothetical protein [Methylobacterium sp. WSM2598]